MELVRFGRTVAAHVVDAVAGRLDGAQPGSRVTLVGQGVDLSLRAREARAEPAPGVSGTGLAVDEVRFAREARHGATGVGGRRTMNERELLLASAFDLLSDGGGADGPAAVGAWGRVVTGRFEGTEEAASGPLSLDGEVTTGVLGADVSWSRWLAGVAVSVSASEGAFDQPGVETGANESRLTSVHPYVRVKLSGRAAAWGLLGYGAGDTTITQSAGGRETRTDIEMRLGALGARWTLLGGSDGPGLALETDAFFVRMESAKALGTLANRADASRARLALEGETAFGLAGGSALTLGAELGLRHDGGDAERGAGLEVGGRARWSDPRTGLSVEVGARMLVAHEVSDYAERGASGSIRLDPGVSGRGFSFTFAPAWGAASGGVERLWSAQGAGALAAKGRHEPASRLDTEVAYGVDALGGLLTPYGGFALGGDAGTWRAGARFRLGERFTMGLEGNITESGGDKPAGELRLESALRW